MFNAFLRFVRGLLMLAIFGGLIAAAAWYRELWLPLLQQPAGDRSVAAAGEEAPISQAKVLELSPQARQNLKLVSRPAKLSN